MISSEITKVEDQEQHDQQEEEEQHELDEQLEHDKEDHDHRLDINLDNKLTHEHDENYIEPLTESEAQLLLFSEEESQKR
jgi:hypothetical protein